MSPLAVHAATRADYLAWLNNPQPAGETFMPAPVFTWRGADYFCNYSWVESKFLNEGGYVPEQALVLEVLSPMPVVRSDGQAGPALKDAILFMGKSYRVEIAKQAAGKVAQLTCFDASRGS